MDPNVALQELLDMAYEMDCRSDDSGTLARKVLELDEWISHGGFIPQRWSNVVVQHRGVHGAQRRSGARQAGEV